MANQVEITIKAIDDATGTLEGIGSALGNIGMIAAGVVVAGITAAAIAIGTLATDAIAKTREWAEQLDRLGDVTGMTGDTLAAWAFVAKKAGVDVETLARATVILEKGLYKADGTLDITGKALQDYGIAIKDVNGNTKDQSVLMNDIATKYASLGTQTQRVGFLTDLFGRNGAQLVDVFGTLAQEGSIDAVKQKVQALGLVLDSDQYENFQRTLNEIGLVFTGLANAFTGPLLPAAQKLLDLFKNWLESPWISNAIKTIGDNLGKLLDDINTGLTSGDWSKFWGDASAIWDALKFKVEQALNLGLRWLYGNPTAITDFINGIIASLTNTVQNSPSSNLAIAAQDFVTKIADQIGKANWGVLDLALGNAMQDAAYKAFDALASTLGDLLKNLWNYITVPEAPSSGNSYPNATGSGLFGLPTYSATSSEKVVAKRDSRGNIIKVRASGGSAEGLTWVGEEGPELVNLPKGSYVHSAQESRSIGGSMTFVFPNYIGTQQDLKRAMYDAVRQMQLDGRVPS